MNRIRVGVFHPSSNSLQGHYLFERCCSVQNTTQTAGTTLDYTLNVTNNDSAACGSTVFQFSSNLPPGWNNASFSVNNISIAPGTTNSAIMSVASNQDSPVGTYSVGATVLANDGDSNHGAVSASASYIIQGMKPEAPTGVTIIVNQ